MIGPLFELTTEDGQTLVQNGDQLLLTTHGLVRVSRLVSGNVILTSTGGRTSITSIRPVD